MLIYGGFIFPSLINKKQKLPLLIILSKVLSKLTLWYTIILSSQ